MTVREFLEVAWTDGITVIIRENGDGQWLYAYEIGKTVQVGKYDYVMIKGLLKCAGKFYPPQNRVEVSRCDGHCKKLIIPKDVRKAPNEVMDLEISMIRHSYIPFVENPFEICCYPKGWTKPEPEQKKESIDENQLSLF